jgi:hypothetical protein
MNKALEDFLKEAIKDYDDTMITGYYVPSRVSKIRVGQDIFDEMMKDRAYPPGVIVDSFFFEGTQVQLDKDLGKNEVVTYKRLYFTGGINGRPAMHWCSDHKKKYIGFTEVYEYCTVCDNKFPIND